MNQADEFEKGEGDAWFTRNKDKLGLEEDPVIDLIEQHVENVGFVFEVGCANGWRLKRIEELWGSIVSGVDPSREAINAAVKLDIPAYYGTAKNLGWIDSGSVDILIYGFCLYLCDPEDYFEIALEGDRVLKDGGYLIIHDFDANGVPRRVPYEHKKGIFSYHFEFERLWESHPWYQALETWYREDQSFTILKKDSKGAWK